MDIPNNIPAEIGLLGGLIIDDDLRNELIYKVKEDYFYYPRHKTIFKAIKQLYDNNKRIDTLLLAESISDLNSIGGKSYLMELQEDLMSSMNAEANLQIVRENYNLRRLMSLSRAIQLNIGKKESSEIVSLTDKELFNILECYDSEERHIKEVIDDCMIDIVEIQKNNKPKALSTGFDSLNSIMIGWENKLYLLFGKSGIGKSAFTLSLIKEVAKAKVVYLASLEMPDTTWTERLIANLAMIDSKKLRNGWLGKSDLQHIQLNIVPEIKKMNIYISDKPHTISTIKATARRIKKKSGLGLIVIDFMQLVQFDDNYENNELRYSNLAYQLKHLATELNVPILLISSTNKYPENREPRVSDIPYSARVVNACDAIISVHREGYEDKAKSANKFDVHIIKQRSGELGKIELYFDLATQSFREPLEGEFSELDVQIDKRSELKKGLDKSK